MTLGVGAYRPASDSWLNPYDNKRENEAVVGSDALREACLTLFRQFEIEHDLPRNVDAGMTLQLGGYK